MTIPGRLEAARLLMSLEPPAWFLRHACAVADVAAWLAARTAANGGPVEARLVEAAALLHDVDKLPRAEAQCAGLRHGEGSVAWLEAHGMPELAPVVREHPVTRLADPAFGGWVDAASPEAMIVAYADKRAGQALEPMDARFASWRRRYPSGPGAQVAPAPRGGYRSPDAAPTGRGWDDEVSAMVLERARELERRVCAAAGVRPDEVRRLRWSRRAIAAAGAGGAAGRRGGTRSSWSTRPGGTEA
ncbi:MAG TPA: HD domain-containing protein [Candidatus Limnocylindrales bacterium]|nr:HD domain-containing protein [Candidatus Limnocylindrales bacterium]